VTKGVGEVRLDQLRCVVSNEVAQVDYALRKKAYENGKHFVSVLDRFFHYESHQLEHADEMAAENRLLDVPRWLGAYRRTRKDARTAGSFAKEIECDSVVLTLVCVRSELRLVDRCQIKF